jgi:hypothetical protein
LQPEIAQNHRRHVVPRSQCRAGHTDEAELQRGTDPVPRSECLANRPPVSIGIPPS